MRTSEALVFRTHSGSDFVAYVVNLGARLIKAKALAKELQTQWNDEVESSLTPIPDAK